MAPRPKKPPPPIAEPVPRRFDRALPGARSFAVRFWDGSVLEPVGGGEPIDATLVVRSPRALAYMVREPNQLGLGRAWVAGDLDVEGDFEQALRLRERFRDARLGLGGRLLSLWAAWRLGGMPL